MSLSKTYEPEQYESDIYKIWEVSKAFTPKHRRGSKESYSIVVPPPNANGNLHIGHALTLSIQDTLIRYHRMKGRAALLLPGADHAGFETQVVYERELEKQGKSRFDFSREELYGQIWNFVAENKDNYQSQFRKLGASVDWDKLTFTLDQKIIDRSYATFKKLWDDGLVYRGKRLVNFCTHHGTAFADIEVEYTEEKGKMYFIKFPLVPNKKVSDKKDYVLIATTRPETMLGDAAVAIHPDDSRLNHLADRLVKIPLANREVPIITDEMVDTKFGTGAVKITPAHDPNDFEVSERHDLPLIQVITEQGVIGLDAPAVYHDLSVEDARQQVVDELSQLGLLERVEDHHNRVGRCYKCGTTIQPLVREQWFINMEPLAKRAIEALKDSKIKFYPTSKRQQLITYLEGLKDWNISRQIVWGIPIPAFQNIDDPKDWIFDERVDQEMLVKDGKTYRRDSDVFDTWFSSGQWPFATLDYPDSKDFEQFYPLSVMETGTDILAPWVSRMIMLGLYVTNDIPFKSVYLHGLVLDEHGAKMSKSKGNVVNPMDILQEYGSDALRMGILTGQSAGNNQPFVLSKVVGARNFANKLWNIARFIENIVGDNYEKGREPNPKTPADHWILTKLQHSTEKISNDLEYYRLSEAFEELYHTVWDDFADWYIEASKLELNHSVLTYGLEVILKLAHPFAPFVTETIWQALDKNDDTLLITTSWPEVNKGDHDKTKEFEQIKTIVTESRSIIRNLELSKPNLHYKSSRLIAEHSELIIKLAKLGSAIESSDISGLKLTQTSHDCWIEVDADIAKNYLDKLEQRQTTEALSVERLIARLGNESYVNNAPKNLVDDTRRQLEDSRQRLAQITAEIDDFSRI